MRQLVAESQLPGVESQQLLEAAAPQKRAASLVVGDEESTFLIHYVRPQQFDQVRDIGEDPKSP